MKKLRLQVDELRIDTFDTLPRERARGTVDGHEDTIFIWPVTLLCTGKEDATCYEDCTTQDEDLSCMPGCESMTIHAFTCPECGGIEGADTVAARIE
ncbi:MAG TPA: hypothetical protein VFQ39_00165 [Longimicrobium sp.]|nr:hypothetical protein [Longimicrobium sp.]